jgi:hypothetical protein
MGGFLPSSLCVSYEVKYMQMKLGELLRDLFLGFQNLLCNYEGFLRKSSTLLLLI